MDGLGGGDKGWERSRGLLRGKTLFGEEPRTALFAPSAIEGSWSLCWTPPGAVRPAGFAPGVPPSRLRAERCTVVEDGAGNRVRMVEHLLAVLAFWRGTGVVALLDGDALPALDGTAWEWYRLLDELPGAAWGWESYPVALRKRWEWEGGFLEVEPSDRFCAEFTWSAGQQLQTARLQEPSRSSSEAAIEELKRYLWSARTFISADELAKAQEAGVLKPHPHQGVVWREGAGGLLQVVEGGAMRFPNEFAWHKLADLVGDLSLFRYGLPQLKISAHNSGHHWNHQLLRALSELESP